MARSNLWFGDGSFQCVPKIFTQIYTLHYEINDNVQKYLISDISEISEEYLTFSQGNFRPIIHQKICMDYNTPVYISTKKNINFFVTVSLCL